MIGENETFFFVTALPVQSPILARIEHPMYLSFTLQSNITIRAVTEIDVILEICNKAGFPTC